ncbi:MAG: MFS transporter [Pseudobutyrivibrio ruminis]|nr:MFS transporter [Pseudobutyrivibrio ruminis]
MNNGLKKVRPFGLTDNVGYMFGNIGADLVFGLCSGFLMKFYTDVMAVPAAFVGIMMMVARVLDAVTDIGMGQICDKSKEKESGKFRPWIRRIAGPLALSSFLMYAVWFQDMSLGFKVVWMFVTYMLYGSVFYTAFIVPYGSMATAITQDPTERASLANMRNIGGTLAMCVINVALPLIVYYKNDSGNQVLSGTRMAVVAAGISIIAFVLYMACYYMTTERVKLPSQSENGEQSVLRNIKASLNNRATLSLTLVVIIYEIGRQGLSGMAAYFYPNYLGNVQAQSAAGVIETVVTLVMTLAVVPMVRKFGKRAASSIGMGFSAAMLIICNLTHTHSAMVWLVFDALIFVGLGIWASVQWSLVGDIVDDTEVRTGTRADGGIYGAFSFSRKLGQALSSGVCGTLLSIIGYTTATAADEAVVNGIFSVTTLVPAVAYICMIVVLMTLYPLSKKRVEENAAILEERHSK